MESNESNDNNLIGEEIRHRQISALVPEHVSKGVFSTGAILTQGPHEFVVDFLLSMNRPHRVAARVILPPVVLAQVINALADNVKKYETRFGPADPTRGYVTEELKKKHEADTGTQSPAAGGPIELSPPGQAGQSDQPAQPADESARPSPPTDPAANAGQPAPASDLQPPAQGASPAPAEPQQDSPDADQQGGKADELGLTPLPPAQPQEQADAKPETFSAPQPSADKSAGDDGMMSDEEIAKLTAGENQKKQNENRPSVQDVYDDLKIEDEVMSGSYANAVMIGHSTGEFFFDFITNFYPRSAVSCRVYVSARQIPRLLDAFKYSMQRYQNRVRQARMQQRKPGTPGSPGSAGDDGNPDPRPGEEPLG